MRLVFICHYYYIFSPSGWDTDKKIAILAENLMTIKADEDFETVIKRPPTIRRPANRDGEVAAEDHQDFLSRCHNLLAKGNHSSSTCCVQFKPL